MNDDLDKVLRALPELAAPPGLIERTMRRIEDPPPRRNWFARPWTSWPPVWRWALMLVLIAEVVGLCLAQPALAAGLRPIAAQWIAHTAWIPDALDAVMGAAAVLLQRLGKGFLIGLTLVGLVSYLACIGFGTAIYQFTSAIRKE